MNTQLMTVTGSFALTCATARGLQLYTFTDGQRWDIGLSHAQELVESGDGHKVRVDVPKPLPDNDLTTILTDIAAVSLDRECLAIDILHFANKTFTDHGPAALLAVLRDPGFRRARRAWLALDKIDRSLYVATWLDEVKPPI